MARRQSALMRRFERMSRLRNYTLEKGAVDPRGWKVYDATGNAVGVVRDLLVDTDRMTAAYVDVELDTRTFELREDPHIIVPMQRAQQEGRERRLVVPELTRSRVAALYNARAEHELRFWDEWWQAGASGPDAPADWRPAAVPGDAVAPPHGRRPDETETSDARHEPSGDPAWTIEPRPMHPDERLEARERAAERERGPFFDRRRFDE